MPALTGWRLYCLVPPALVCVVLLFVGGPGPDSLRTVRYGWITGHIFCFALWTYLYLHWRGAIPLWRQLLEVVVLCFVIGAAIELLQSRVGREPSLQDIYYDILGGLLTVAFMAPLRLPLPQWKSLMLQVPVVVLVALALLPLARAGVDDLIAWRQFPLLSNFETPFEQTRWGGKSRRRITSEVACSGRNSLRTEFLPGRYPGVFLNFFPSDWRSYEQFGMQIYNPSADSLGLHLRIHDQLHRSFDNLHRDRFNTELELKPGWNRIVVPLAEAVRAPRDRSLDLQRIAGVGLYMAALDQPRHFYVDDVRLLAPGEMLADCVGRD